MKRSIIALSLILLAGCVATTRWQANTYHDEFTEETTCRVEMGSAHQREFGRAMMRTYFAYNFYAENHEGEIRAGVRSEPAIPINGDVQIKVGDTLYTMTAADTPLDTKPTMPAVGSSEEFNKNYAEAMDTMQKFASPYRAFTGKKAKSLIKDILNTGGEIKFRTVGVNAATSGTGSFTVDEDFKTALQNCHIIE